METVKQIFDNVHGFIGLNEREFKIISNPLFQRLRRIHQLGMANYVFPGAEHTRFAHSLGAMFVVNEMGDALKERSRLDNDDIEKLRLAALLHDIGHYPLSHTIEEALVESFGQRAKHEVITEKILVDSSIADMLGRSLGREIARIIRGKHSNPIYTQLITSELDADRLDYLARDSVHTGVALGRIDAAQLIRTLDVDKNNLVGINVKGMHAAESYAFARFHMYAQVYSHKTVGILDRLVQISYQLMMKGRDKNLPDYEELAEPFDEEAFLQLDDPHFFAKLQESSHSRDAYLAYLCRAILDRTPFKLVKEAKVVVNRSVRQTTPDDAKRLSEYTRLQEFRETPGLFDEKTARWVVYDSPDLRLASLKPNLAGVGKGEKRGVWNEAKSSFIRIIQRDGRSTELLQDPSSLLRYAGDITLDVIRVYGKNDEKVLKAIASKLESFGIEPDM